VLTNMDGEELSLPVNSDVVKRYCLESGEIKDVAACSFIFVCLLGFPQGFPSTIYLSS